MQKQITRQIKRSTYYLVIVLQYPKTKRKVVRETLHGHTIEDPYRWLEDYDDQEVQQWLQKQHDYRTKVLEQIPNKNEAIQRIREFLSLGEHSTPKKKKEYLYYTKRKTENQPILYRRKEDSKKEELLIDPNQLSKEHPVSLDWFEISPDNKYLLYGLSKDGDEWSTLYIKDLNKGKKLSDEIPRARRSTIAWLPDESGFYYTRYPLPGTVPEGEENYNQKIYFHTIGKDWKKDPLVFGEGLPKTNHYGVNISKDGRYLLINVHQYTTNELYLKDLEKNTTSEVFVQKESLAFGVIQENTLWFITNHQSPNWQIMKTTVTSPEYDSWATVVPEKETLIDRVLITNKRLFIVNTRNAQDYLQVYTHSGEFIKEIDLPEIISIRDIGNPISVEDAANFYFSIQSFFYPKVIYNYHIADGELEKFFELTNPLPPEEYTTKQVWYESKDGTKVPMFLIHQKELELNRNNPTILTGYGGFNISIKPPYLRNSRYFWLEKGGVIAIVNLRGGSEFGEQWHKEGMLEKKQNVFDDFIYAAKWLIKNGYTSEKHLGIYGRSNGGLLVGAAVTQQPELFAAVYCCVPLLDMIRYHKFSIARFWIPEYGSAENEDQFDFLLEYSPYHNVIQGTNYPATYFVAAQSDSRVVPIHAMKMNAMMQWANSSDEPILLYVEEQAGHGVGKPLDKLAETESDIYLFLGWKTGLKL
jgi:prolyl oligopeptidase